MNFLLLFGILIILQMMFNDVEGGCSVKFTQNQIHERQPIFLINRGKEYNFARFKRDGDFIRTTIVSDKHLKVACANWIYEKVDTKKVNVSREKYTIYCINKKIAIYNNEGKYIGNDSTILKDCNVASTSYTAITKESCGGNGNIVKVGFYVSLLQTVISGKIQRKFINDGLIHDAFHLANLANMGDTTIVTNKHLCGINEYYQEPPEAKFLPPTLIKAYEACIITSKKKVLYTFHEIYGPALNIGKTPNENTFKYYKKYSKLKSQNELSEYERIMKGIYSVLLFGQTHIPTLMEQRRRPILKQFVQPLEMPSYVFGLSTFFSLNTFTLWNHIECNWLNVENQIRKLATMRSISLEIYTGKVENPNFLWKIVQFKYTKDYMDKNSLAYKGIAFVTDNSKDNTGKSFKAVCPRYLMGVCKKYEWAVSTTLTKLGVTCCIPVSTLLESKIFPFKIEAIENILNNGSYSDLSFAEEEQILNNITEISNRKKGEILDETHQKVSELGAVYESVKEEKGSPETVLEKVKGKEEDPEAELEWSDSHYPTNLDEYLGL